MSSSGSTAHDQRMTNDLLEEADSIALDIMRRTNVDPDRPVSTKTMAARMTGHVAQAGRILDAGQNAIVSGVHRIFWNVRLPNERVTWVVGHELCHVWFRMREEAHEHEDLVCDIVGAMLVAPREAFRRAVRTVGQRVHALAGHFKTTEALALLRVGEVTGRSVLLVRPSSRIARGEPFVWPEDLRSVPRSVAHPIRVDGRWGMMAA